VAVEGCGASGADCLLLRSEVPVLENMPAFTPRPLLSANLANVHSPLTVLAAAVLEASPVAAVSRL